MAVTARQAGTGHIESLDGAAAAISALSGYVSPNLQSLRLNHNAEVKRIKGQNGRVTGLHGNDDFVECTFEFMPEGTTIANAKKSAGLPNGVTAVTLSGLPVIEIGPFTDVFNDGGTNPWFYEGGGSLNGPADGPWTATIVLRRYPGITSGSIIVA